MVPVGSNNIIIRLCLDLRDTGGYNSHKGRKGRRNTGEGNYPFRNLSPDGGGYEEVLECALIINCFSPLPPPPPRDVLVICI